MTAWSWSQGGAARARAARVSGRPMNVPFSGVSRTLFIPLVGRALAEELHPDLGFRDPAAKEVLGRLGVDPRPFQRDGASMRGAVVRARSIDRLLEVWFQHHPSGLGVSLGGGLDHRLRRIDNGSLRWVDLDLPEVTRVKRSLWNEGPRYRMVEGSLTDASWLERVGARAGEPVVVVIEGVLMYLKTDQVRRFFQEAAARLPAGSTIIFDAAHEVALRVGVRPLGVLALREGLHWGLARPEDVCAWAPALTVGQQISITDSLQAPFRLIGGLFARMHQGQPGYSVIELHVGRSLHRSMR